MGPLPYRRARLYRKCVTASRTLRISGLLIAVSAVALALIPFHGELPVHATGALMSVSPLPASISLRSSCGAPVIEALRHAPADGGWFGYTPLTSTVVDVRGIGCPRPARQRLGISLAGLVLASVLGAIAIGLDRRRGFGGTADPRFAT